MKKRMPMKKSTSRKFFKKGAMSVHGKNVVRAPGLSRGGIRL